MTTDEMLSDLGVRIDGRTYVRKAMLEKLIGSELPEAPALMSVAAAARAAGKHTETIQKWLKAAPSETAA